MYKRNKIQKIQYFFVCLFFVSLNFDFYSPLIENFSLSKMAAFLYFVSMMFTPYKTFEIDRKIRKVLHPWVIIFLIITVIGFVKINYYSSSFFDFSLFQNILMFWILLNHYKNDSKIFSEGFIWFVFSSFLISLLYILNIGVVIDIDGRLTMFQDDPNSIGLKMVISTLFLIDYCLNNGNMNFKRPIYLLMLVLIIPLIIATASRVAFLALFAGMIVFFTLKKTKKIFAKIFVLLIGFIFFIFIFNFAMQNETLNKRLNKTYNENNVSGRDDIWKFYVPIILENPIFGVGPTGKISAANIYFNSNKSPHNVFIEVALYSGFVGIIFFLLFLYRCFINLCAIYKLRGVLSPLLLSIPLLGMLFSVQMLHVKIAWVILAYMYSFTLTTRNEISY